MKFQKLKKPKKCKFQVATRIFSAFQNDLHVKLFAKLADR
jgi:hypothetical protein